VIDSITSLGTILGIWAHPDDEAYLMGGVMAMAADAGQEVACVTATLGDAGETADPHRWPKPELRRVREDELAQALSILGVRDHACLGLPDGQLAELDAAGPVAHLVTVIERVRPDTVLTFGPDGMTGHPDHRTVCTWARLALGSVAAPARLLFATKTGAFVDAFPDLNGEVFPPGLPPQVPADRAWSPWLDDAILDRKVRALEAHASQTTGIIDAFGRDRYAEWVRLEAFTPVPQDAAAP
jgi:LmbE family N-acetylglucosaminyl deacetylase